MNTYQITYRDERDLPHTEQVEAVDVEAAIDAIEEQLNQQIVVRKINILDEESAA